MTFGGGDVGKTAYLVDEGKVDVSIDGRRVATLGPGDVAGIVPLLLHDPTALAATYVTAEGARLTAISGDDFERWAAESPDFLYNLAHSLCRRLESSNRMAVDLSHAIDDELDHLAGSPRSCETAFRRLAEQIRKSGGPAELVERALSQAERAVAARERMAGTYRRLL